MLNASLFLGALCVVEAVERSYEITRDTSDALERHVRETIDRVDKIAVDLEIDPAKMFFGILRAGALDIVIDLLLRQFSAAYVNVYHVFPLPKLTVLVGHYYCIIFSYQCCDHLNYNVDPVKDDMLYLFYHNILYKSMVILHNILKKTLSDGIVMRQKNFVRF